MADAAVIDSRTLYLRLLRYVHPYRRTFAISLLSMVLLACTEPILPALLKPLLDGSFIEQDAGARLTVPGLLVLLFLFRGGITYASDVSVNWVAQKVVLDLRQQMFRNLVMLPSAYFDTTNSSVLISKLSFDVTQVAQAATRGVTVLIKDSLAVLGLFCYMLYLNWMLSLTVLIVAPVVGLVIVGASRRLRLMSQKVQHSMGAITEVAQEAIDCHKAVKIYHGRDHETGRFYRAADENRKFTMKIATVSAANVPIIQALMAVVLAAVTYLAATLSVAGELTIGDFVAFFTAMTLLLPPIKRITGINEHLQRGLAAAQSVFSLIDEAPEPDSGARDCKPAHGDIEYENVSLAYEPRLSPALHGISVKIEAGETIALVGPSGSGKSSFANLLPRFYCPGRGRILLDGVDIADLSLHALRRNIALVTQEVLLFNDTVRNNIAYGAMREASAAAILRAVEAAHVSDFIATMPEGLDTLIGENGVRLSGGQRQRLAIARAILKDAPLLILDEATSSLDSISEQHIQAALETLRRGRTCIIIAHRLSTIENADRIIVLKHGKIEEIGTHDELLRRHGTYARLHRLQFRSHAAAVEMRPRRGEESTKIKKTVQE